MGDSYDVERLRRELAQYGDLNASRDERSLQALMGELIQLTHTDPNDGSPALETDTASVNGEREDHSIERAAAYCRGDMERVSSSAVAQSSSVPADAQRGTVAAQSGGSDGVFSARRWVVVCAAILILIGTVTAGPFVFRGNGPENSDVTTVSVQLKLEQPSRSDNPSEAAPVRPDVSEPAATAERTEPAGPAPGETMPQPVPSTEGTTPPAGQAGAETIKPPDAAQTTTKPVSPNGKKRSANRRRAPQPARF